MSSQDIAKELERLRGGGWTMAAIAAATGVPERSLYRYAAGQGSPMRPELTLTVLRGLTTEPGA